MNRLIVIGLLLTLIALVLAGFEVRETTESLELHWMDMPVSKDVIDIYDNRDYEGDTYEVYLFGDMVGEYYHEDKEFTYLRTGK